ncbi:hypothetical protein AAFC00_002134 [Neodothiora populina]|uniref:DUF7514 domain-containing protein n=1 Tax=Neodothiora populina TaxID=2781224 RepID=A0ABR3PGE0_9PEZI
MTADDYSPSRDESPYSERYDSRRSSQRSSVYFGEADGRLPRSPRANPTAKVNNASAGPPLHDTIQSAVKNTGASNQVDPDLIAHISEQVTQNVLNAFKTKGLPTNSFDASPPPPPQHQSTGVKGNRHTPDDSTHQRSAPPSPTDFFDPLDHDYHPASPEPIMLSETSSHASEDAGRKARRRESDASPSRGDSSWTRPMPSRPSNPMNDATILEKAWQPLFENGRPTARLGQFLRGLAVHMIDDFEPRNSLIVTPGKMLRFFREMRQPDETYPFQDVFGGKCTNVSISRMYRGLGCEHHLTQLTLNDDPTIPGLTPRGFATFFTTLIQAYPDREFNRLGKSVLKMPISNADCRTERFPKELSRRLFPRDEDRASQQKLWLTISADRNLQLRTSNPMPPPPPPSAQPPTLNTAFVERERNPYSSTPSSSVPSASSTSTANEDMRTTKMPLERERQPYTGREGTGKIFADRDHDYSTNNAARNGRSNSTTPTVSSFSNTPVNAMDMPPLSSSQRQQRSSMSGGRSGYAMSGTSPPMNTQGSIRSPYIKSEGANISEVPREYYASNIPSFDSFDENRRYGGGGAGGRQRSATDQNGFHGGGGNRQSTAGPGSGSGRNSTSNTTANVIHHDYDPGREQREARRRSVYSGAATGPAPGGSDGYGSYQWGDSTPRHP